MFLPHDETLRNTIQNLIEKIVIDENQDFLGWRDVPVDPDVPGEGARRTQPFIKHCFIGANKKIKTHDEFERKLIFDKKNY